MNLTLGQFLEGMIQFFKNEIVAAPGPVSRARAKAIAAALEEYRDDIIALGEGKHKVSLSSFFGSFKINEK